MEGGIMFWPDIFLMEERSLPSVIASNGRRGNLIHPKERYIWAQVRILRETDKAASVDNGMKIWIPKSQIRRIRLRNNVFEICGKESTIG